MFLCYIYPAILDYCLYYQKSDSTAIRHKIIDFCLFVFGCTVILVGVAAAIYNWFANTTFEWNISCKSNTNKHMILKFK